MAARRAPPSAPAVNPSAKPKSSAAAAAASRKAAHLISRAEMARKLGVSRAAVTQACRPGERLHEACDGSSINVLHESARRWLFEREGAKLKQLPPLPPIEVDDAPEEPRRPVASLEAELGPGQRVDLAALAEPLTTLTERYGDVREFESWVRTRKALEEARKAEMLRERIEGRLIARTTVDRMVDHIDVAFRLLLSDAPRAIATRIAPQDVAAVAALVRDVMSQHLKGCREHMDQSLAADDPLAPLAEAAE